MKCPACERDNREQAGFCAFCGIPLPSDDAQTQPSTAPVLPAEQSLASGTLLGGRYRITAVLKDTPTRNRYQAVDLAHCTACGSDENSATDTYCAKCGAMLEPYRTLELDEHLLTPPAQHDLVFIEGGRTYYGYLMPEQPPALAAEAPGGLRLSWGLATDKGAQRDQNEDYVEGRAFTRYGVCELAFFVVADGLGGQDSGEVASRMTVEALWQALEASTWTPAAAGKLPPADAIPQLLLKAVQAANSAILEARRAQNSQMTSTLTCALLAGGVAYIANIGDSRTYLHNQSGLQRVTKDHSLVQRLVDTKQIRPQDVYTHPQRNLIYQSIGDRPDPQIDLFRRTLKVDDRLVLCSDGLWEMARDEGIEEVLLSEANPQRACDQLVEMANLAGGDDNITVIIVQVA